MRDSRLLCAALLVAVISACKSADDISVPAGLDVDYVALLELDDSGAVISSSQLVPWSKDQGLSIYAEGGATAVLIGWSAADLQRDISLEILNAKRPRLEAAVGCRQRLLPPKYYARWSGGELVEIPAAEAPPVALAGEELACPSVQQNRLLLDLRCEVGRCAPVVTYPSRCTARLDLEACGYGVVRSTFDRDGNACLDFSESSLDCSPREEDALSNASYLCDAPVACPLDFYAQSEAVPPPFTLERTQLFDAPIYYARLAERTPILYRGGIFSGYAYDMILSGDQVIVSGSQDDEPNANCGDRTTSRFFFFDQESLTLTHTSTAPHCSKVLRESGDGQTFFGAYLEVDVGWWLARYDRRGNKLGEVRLTLPRDYSHVNEIRRSGQDLVILNAEEHEGNIVLVYDVATLAEKLVVDLRGSMLSADSMELFDADTAMIAADNTREIIWLNIATGEEEERVGLDGDPSFYHDLMDIQPDPVGDGVLVFGRGKANVFVVDRAGRFVDELTIFHRDMVGINALPWPRGQRPSSTMFFSAIEVVTWQSFGLLLDVADRRFYPGLWPIGHGPAIRPVRDARGRDYYLLPWAAEVVRLTPN